MSLNNKRLIKTKCISYKDKIHRFIQNECACGEKLPDSLKGESE